MKLAKNWKWTCRAQGDFAQLLCAALALCWLTAPSLAGAVTVTLSASDDAWIDQGAKDANNGADTVLRVKSGTGATAKKHVLAKFDLSGIPAECATVTSAALHLVITTPPSGNRTHNLHRITATWAEGTVTWNNQPTFNGTAAASATASSGGGTVTWDVTSEVTAFLSGSAVNYGWLVKDSVDSTIAEVVYGSDENGTPSSRPQLEVIYTTSDVACDDSNPCTDDTCHETMGCQYAYNDDSCEDGLFCNGTDTCSGGSCGHSGDPCTGGLECNNVCNEGADNCAVTAGTPCTPDGNVCTDDECDGAGSCGVNNAAPCDDGEFCNGTDTCSGGTCGHSGNPCTSGPECNNDCNEEADNCVVAEGTPCSADRGT